MKAEGSIFSGYRIYQEYPVNRINPSYKNASHKFDWVISDIFLVIEGHGEQHYRPVQFGGISADEAIEKLADQKYRDDQKMQAAIDAGFTYIVIPFSDHDKIDEDYIWQLYNEHKNPNRIPEKAKTTRQYPETRGNPRKNPAIKERERQYRREQYRRQKEYADAIKQQRRANDDPNSS